MSSRRSASPNSNSDRSDASAESDVSHLAAIDVSPRCSAKHASFGPSPTSSRNRDSPKDSRPIAKGSFVSQLITGKESPSVISPKSKLGLKGDEHDVVHRSPKELFAVRSCLASSTPSPGKRSLSMPQLQAAHTSCVDGDSEQRSRMGAAINLKNYIDDPLMKLRTNREHSDLVIRERDDEPHLRFMSLHFTPATTHAVNAFRSDWSEDSDALLQDDVFLGNKRAAFFCLFSDKRSLQSPNVRAHILRPSEIRDSASSDPDRLAAQAVSEVDVNGTASLYKNTPTANSALSPSAVLPADMATCDSGAHPCCHAVIHNVDTGASALCKMNFDFKHSAAASLVDLPEVVLPASSIKHARPFPSRKGRPPAASPAASPAVEDLSVPSKTETRSYSCVTLNSLGKERTKCCIVPSMQQGDFVDLNAEDAPDMITPALGHSGQCSLEDFEEFYSKEWKELGPIDREIRFEQLQLLSVVRKNTVYRNAVADALQAEINAKSDKQHFPVADQKQIESALAVSSRTKQLQITMQAGLQPRNEGVLLPGDPESEGDDAVCCVCFCGESLDDNQIVFCEGCNMAVHQSCYGIKYIPDGDWFCDSCVLSCKPTCVICHRNDGAFKVCVGACNAAGASQVDSGLNPQSSKESKQWIHVMCALWHPEVSFESLAVMREADVSCAEFFSKKTCVFCRKNGYLMSCPGKCRQQYHPMCAWLAGWFIDYKNTPKPSLQSLSRKRESEPASEAVLQMALLANTNYVPPMAIAAKCLQCLEPSLRKTYDPNYNCKIRRLLSQVPSASGSKATKRGSAAVLEDGSGRRMLHLVRRTFLPPDEFPPGSCMICHFDVHNANRRKLRRSRLLVCSRGCGASVHESCANILPDDSCVDVDGSWTCMLCMEQESLGAVECMLCPRRGGLFQRCSEYPGWLHCICARLLCNIRPGFKGFSVSESVTTGTLIQDYRDAKSKRVCCFCRQQGKVLHCCAHPGCEKHMHPMCAMIKECKSTVDTSKNGKNNCTLFCAQHSPVADFAEADARALQEDVKSYSRLLDLRVYFDKMRDLVNFCRRRERWKNHLDTVDNDILEQYEDRMLQGDASLCSAAILAPPVFETHEPSFDSTVEECNNVAEGDFLPKKREKTHAIWFDVPNRGGIGMLHVAKRKCPEIMFRYLNHLCKASGKEGWVFPTIEDDKLQSPAKMRHHHLRSGKTIFPPSPSGSLNAGLSPRVLRQGKEFLRSSSVYDGFPPSPIGSARDRSTRSQRGSFGFAAASSTRAASQHAYSHDSDSSASVCDDVEEINPGTLPRIGTKVKIRHGRYKGRSGTIIGHSGIGWFTVNLNWVREDVKVRKHEFRVVQKEKKE